MRIRLLALLLLAFITVAFAAVPSSVYFVENLGQWDGDFRFRASFHGGSAFVTEGGLVLDLRAKAEGGRMKDEGRDRSDEFRSPPASVREARSRQKRTGGPRGGEVVRGHVLRLTFLDASSCPEMLGEDKLASYSNYFLGRDSSRWKSRVGHYQRVLSQEVWLGINVEYVLKPGGVELVYHLLAGADPAQIQLQIEGLSSPLTLDAAGNLELPTSLGPLVEQAPTAFQSGRAISCRYRLSSDSTYGFTLDNYDPQQEIVIDPLLYSSYIGGGNDDWIDVLVFDSTHQNLLLGGTTVSSNFPTTTGVFQEHLHNWNYDLFISRFDNDGRSLVFSTYLGGSNMEMRCGLLPQLWVVYGYCVLTHSGDWPLTPSAVDTSYTGSSEGAFWQLSTDGTQLLYSSYWGGSGGEYIEDLQRDCEGHLYLTGRTGSVDFRITPDAMYSQFQGNEPAYVSVFDSTATTLLYSTFFPSSGSVYVSNMVIVAPFRVWLSGNTEGGIPLTPNALQTTPATAFLACLDLAADSLIYSSYFGGGGEVGLMAMHVADSQRVLLTGRTTSGNFPLTPHAFDTTRGGMKSFATWLLLPDSVLYSTLLGSPSLVGRTAMSKATAVDPATGNVWLGGRTESPDFPCTADAVDSLYTDPAGEEYADGFVACFSPDLDSLLYGSYIGGGDRDIVTALAFENSQRLWIGGYTASWDYPVTAGAFQGGLWGNDDGCYALLTLPVPPDTGDTSTTRTPHSQFPSAFSLSAFPNPFNSTTEIRYALPRAGHVSLTVFDVLGREVGVLVDDVMAAGEQRAAFDARGLASGIYFVRMDAGGMNVTRKVLLVR